MKFSRVILGGPIQNEFRRRDPRGVFPLIGNREFLGLENDDAAGSNGVRPSPDPS